MKRMQNWRVNILVKWVFIFAVLFLFLLIAPSAFSQTRKDAETPSQSPSTSSLKARIRTIVEKQKMFADKQAEIQKELDQLRIWIHRG